MARGNVHLRSSTGPLLVAGLVLAGLVGAAADRAVAANAPAVAALPVSSGVRPIVVPITPCRLVDTRQAARVGPRGTPLGTGETYTVTATGSAGNCAVPSGAVGLVINVTAIHATSASYLTVWPADSARPAASNLNWVAGQAPTPNQVTVGLSASGTPGQASFYNAAGSVDLVVDVAAYLADHNFDDRYYTKAQTDALAPPVPVNRQRVATLQWYAANHSSNFPVGRDPHGIVYDGANIWVANEQGNSVTKIRPSDGATLGTYPVSVPYGIAYDGANLWVSDNAAGTVRKIRPSDGAILATVPVGNNPTQVAFDGTNIWVINYTDRTLSKIRASDGADMGTFPTGIDPFGILCDGTNIWVNDYTGNDVIKIRASDGTQLGKFPTGHSPAAIAYDGAYLWVTNNGDGTVSKIRASDGVTFGTYTTGAVSTGVAFDGANIWVLNLNASTVTEFRSSDGAVIGTFPTGTTPSGIAFDGTNMWVINTNGGQVAGGVSKL
jgi:outer membrane lipoprotein-sorting protein